MNNRLLFRRAVYRGTHRKFVRFVYFDVLKHNQIKDSRIDLDNDIDQCLGLQDQYGNLIYERDIVKVGDDIGVIKWVDHLARFVISMQDVEPDFDNYDSYELEVIGNLHQNKDLIEDLL